MRMCPSQGTPSQLCVTGRCPELQAANQPGLKGRIQRTETARIAGQGLTKARIRSRNGEWSASAG